VTMADLDFKGGLVRVTRVKGRKQTEWVVLPVAVQEAIEGMPAPATRADLSDGDGPADGYEVGAPLRMESDSRRVQGDRARPSGTRSC
jgi:hypothetical protein